MFKDKRLILEASRTLARMLACSLSYNGMNCQNIPKLVEGNHVTALKNMKKLSKNELLLL